MRPQHRRCASRSSFPNPRSVRITSRVNLADLTILSKTLSVRHYTPPSSHTPLNVSPCSPPPRLSVFPPLNPDKLPTSSRLPPELICGVVHWPQFPGCRPAPTVALFMICNCRSRQQMALVSLVFFPRIFCVFFLQFRCCWLIINNCR